MIGSYDTSLLGDVEEEVPATHAPVAACRDAPEIKRGKKKTHPTHVTTASLLYY